VLKDIFDQRVGYDFDAYYKGNTDVQTTLQSLFKKHVIKADQAKLLPPKENKPDSSKYDITLLSCLLRNVCGLAPVKDVAWDDSPSNLTLEADITRLRKCRNEVLVH
jgi:hypothetical protein